LTACFFPTLADSIFKMVKNWQR